ncbi:MAG: MerR family transcriptional regulator [Tepidiformaceae bacterium]
MRIGALARQLGTTPHALRFYERRGLLPAAGRTENGYREYTEAEADRLRLLRGLRQLDLPLVEAAELASVCADGRCDRVSQDLRAALARKRLELAQQIEELRFLDQHLAHLAGQLSAGHSPRPLITLGKEERHES